MGKKSKGTVALVIAGLTWGAALGVGAGALVVGPALHDAPGTAQETGHRGGGEADARRLSEAEAQVAAANAALEGQSGALVEDSLKGKAVVILRGPGAAPADVAKVRELLDAAGATNAGEIALSGKFASQAGADQLSSLIANTLPAGAQLSVENRSPGLHAGESFAAALFADDAGQPRSTPEDRDFMLSALADAGLLDGAGSGLAAADAAVLVTGPDGEDEAAAFAERTLADFATGLAQSDAPVVVATPGPAADDGIAAALEDAQGAATQEVVDTEAGAVLTVRKVAEVLG